MKRKLMVGVAVVFTMSLAVAGLSFAVEVYGAAGCGLGSMIFGDQPGIMQVLAATTNGTSGNQTFGITSGTSNCEKQPKFASSERLNEFVLANMDNLAKEVAIGQGESLDTLAELIGIAADKRPSVYAKLQTNFSNIFTSEKVVFADVIDNILAVING
jgi:hypothetical protein